MPVSRYSRSKFIKRNQGLTRSEAYPIIYNLIANKTIGFTRKILKDGERLDSIAGSLYGDSALWWVIAAASGIGWNLQVPSGTVITIPSNISEIYSYVG